MHTGARRFLGFGTVDFEKIRQTEGLILQAKKAPNTRIEIVALYLSEVNFVAKGVELWQRSSKTDQTGEGRLVGIEAGKRPLTCPIRALRAWLDVRGTWEGPLFPRFTPASTISHEALQRRAGVLHVALKRALEEVGEDSRRYGAHSLRAGMITEASKHGASEASIKQRTGHKCSVTLQKYIRPANVFEFNPMRSVL